MTKEKKIYSSFRDIPPREYMYFPKGTLEQKKPGSFSRTEITHLAVSIGVLTVAFAFAFTGGLVLGSFLLGGKQQSIIAMLPVAFFGILTGFFFHELAHRYVAHKYRLWAEFRMYPLGLLLALFLGVFFGFVFAAPGAVVIRGGVKSFEMGNIAVAGPLANVAVAASTAPLFLYVNFSTPIVNKIIGAICIINAVLATFNLLPFGPLDGIKILRWNFHVWIVLFAVAIAITVSLFPFIYTICF